MYRWYILIRVFNIPIFIHTKCCYLWVSCWRKNIVYDVLYTIYYFKNTQGWFNGYDVQTRSSTWWNTYPSNFEDTNQIQLDSSSTGKASKYKFDEETLQNGFFEFGWCAGLWWNDLTLSRNSRYVWHYPFEKSGEVIYIYMGGVMNIYIQLGVIRFWHYVTLYLA